MVWVAGDADGESDAGDALGDVVGEGGVGGAGGGDRVHAAGDGLVVDGVGLVVARVLLMMVPSVGPCPPWWGASWVEVVCWFTVLGGVGCLWCRW